MRRVNDRRGLRPAPTGRGHGGPPKLLLGERAALPLPRVMQRSGRASDCDASHGLRNGHGRGERGADLPSPAPLLTVRIRWLPGTWPARFPVVPPTSVSAERAVVEAASSCAFSSGVNDRARTTVGCARKFSRIDNAVALVLHRAMTYMVS